MCPPGSDDSNPTSPSTQVEVEAFFTAPGPISASPEVSSTSWFHQYVSASLSSLRLIESHQGIERGTHEDWPSVLWDLARMNAGRYDKGRIGVGGPVMDMYLRDGLKLTPTMDDRLLLSRVSSVLSTTDPTKSVIYIEPSKKDLVIKMLQQRGRQFAVIPVEQHDEILPILVESRLKDSIIADIGHIGALPVRDKMIRLMDRRVRAGFDSKLEILFSSMEYRANIHGSYTQRIDRTLGEHHIHWASDNCCDLFQKIQDGLAMALLKYAPDGSDGEARGFYYYFVQKMLNGLCSEMAELREANDLTLRVRLNLIHQLLCETQNSDYAKFQDCMGLISGELMLLSSHNARQGLSDEQSYDEVIAETTDTLEAFLGGERPSHVGFDTSGMGAISNFIQLLSLQACQIDKDGIAGLWLQHGCYFKIAQVLGLLFGARVLPGRTGTLWTDGHHVMKMKASDRDGIRDVIIDSPEHNVFAQASGQGYGSSDIERLIEQQFELRQKADIDKPLIVLIDATMSDFDDAYIPQIQMHFKDKIDQGKLLIVTTHSLNKLFSIGLDKTPAGLYYILGQIDKFPMLKAILEAQSKSQFLGGFRPKDATMLLIRNMLKYCRDLVTFYPTLLRARRRLIQQNCFKDFKAGFISIDPPESRPTRDGVSIDSLSNYSIFVTIRTTVSRGPQIGLLSKLLNKSFMSLVSAMLKGVNVLNRDGFGFIETSVVTIDTGTDIALRISIGTESSDELQSKFKLIAKILTRINEIVDEYSQRIEKSYQELLRQQRSKVPTLAFSDPAAAKKYEAQIIYSKLEPLLLECYEAIRKAIYQMMPIPSQEQFLRATHRTPSAAPPPARPKKPALNVDGPPPLGQPQKPAPDATLGDDGPPPLGQPQSVDKTTKTTDASEPAEASPSTLTPR